MLSLLLALTAPSLAQDTGDFGDTGFVAPPIVGGTQAPVGKWDDTVGIVFGGQYVGCTGTLVGPRTVVTAAHCLGNVSHVLVGTNDYADQSQGELIEVTRENRHPDYGGDGGNDIAVLNLAGPSQFTPRAISQDCTVGYAVDGVTVQAVGFGSTSPNGDGYNSKLNEIPLVVTDADCSEGYGCSNRTPNAGELAAVGQNGDTCSGDSGGPAYLNTDYGWVLLGVTSRGPIPCGQGGEGIYSRADTYLPWITSVAGGDVLATPACNEPPEIILQPFDDVGNKGTYRTSYAINDTDSTAWTYEIDQPTYGTIAIDGNELVFTGDGNYVGADQFVFRAIDDYGNPAEVTVPLNIVDGRAGCGCATTGTPAGLWALGLTGLLLVRRRRD